MKNYIVKIMIRGNYSGRVLRAVDKANLKALIMQKFNTNDYVILLGGY